MKENKRVLVIDDDESIRQTYHSILLPDDEPDSLSLGRALFDMPMEDDDAFSPSSFISGDSLNHFVGATNGNLHGEEQAGYEVTLADQGTHGIACVEAALEEETPFAVAFIDMKMPGLNGAETASRIWEMDPRIKIVIVTAYSEYSPEDIIAVTGRDDLFYLRKPFNHEEILQFARALSNTWNLEQKKANLQKELEAANQALEGVNKGLEEKVRSQASMIVQAEKMASIGLLAAGVAHEINNPLAYVRSNISTSGKYFSRIVSLLGKYAVLEKYLAASSDPTTTEMLQALDHERKESRIDLILDDLEDLIDESLDGVDRIRDIVQDLRTFSRVDESGYRALDINQALEGTLKILKPQINEKIRIERDFGEIPRIQCYPQKISQVFMNLLINAAQAIEDEGCIALTTRSIPSGAPSSHGFVEVVVADDGCGIPEENLQKLFDPFFTTKPVGTGTGLGLSIVYEIIDAHGGKIEVTSGVGKGTRFRILLPQTTDSVEG